MSCHYCGNTERETRPYGPGGTDVCHPCATATPEREEAAKNAFYAQSDAAEAISPHAVTILAGGAPEPLI